MARDAANDARLAAAAKAKAEALTPAAIAAKTTEQVAAGVKSTDPKARLEGETASQANARITAGYRNQARPELTETGKAAGATLEFVRTGAGGVGTYKEIYPIGTPIPTERTTAYGNVYDAKGNLIEGSGLKTPPVSDATLKSVAERNAAAEAKIRAEESAKLKARFMAEGLSEADALKKVDEFWAEAAASFSANSEFSNSSNNFSTGSQDKTLVSTETDEYGNVIGVYSDSSTKILIPSGRKYKSTVDEDAYSILESTFKDFGLEELVPEIKKFMEAGLGSNQAAVELRKTQAYTTRFKGNEVRRAAGLNVLSEAEYLALEDSYSETLRAYGLQNYFGIDRKVKTASMADIIGNDISAIEFKDRIDTVVTRVNNSDPTIKNTLNAFYNITDTDLVKYFLNPKENLPKLQEKVTAAEIGSAALSQGLVTDVNRATALAQMGITKEKAQEGYEAIGGALPTTTKLSQIYGEEGINYTQATAEEEVFKQLESAKRKRLKLAEKEVGSFSGAAGLGRNALGTGKSSAF